MSLRVRLLIGLLIASLIPIGLNAQEKKKFEINVGISMPGADELNDTELFDLGLEDFGDYYFRDESLSNLDESYNSIIYPCYTLEIAYDLAESGFFKKLDLLGYVSYHSAIFENMDLANLTSSRETARKWDILIGVRYDIIEKERFNMYTQFLAGGDILDSSKYWDYIFSEYEDDSHPIMQFTFLGFNWKLGGEKSNWGVMAELGYGTEYAVSVIPIIPGFRFGLSYKF
ncbi:MAG: hypothetical protein J6Y78_07145 [Paludibacteraceae bacterium]|nr:hypothetical protein [Paludibacteraceae bacterium]